MASNLIVGQEALDFTLNDLDGQPHRLSDFRGRIVLVAFWSADCPWVERMEVLFKPMLQTWGERAVYLPVASNANESPTLLHEVAARRGLPTVLWDPNTEIANQYGAEITPEFFVIDEQGVLRYQGAFDDINFRQRKPTRFYVREVVDALLAGIPPETDHTAAYGCTIVRFTDLVA
jgi:peroxiredoxin